MMKRDILILAFFGFAVVAGFIFITLSVAKVFVSNVNSVTNNYYYAESNNGLGE